MLFTLFLFNNCDVSRFCPLFPTLEKCHLGRHRPSNWHLWQSTRLKGHAPIGMGSPGCAVSSLLSSALQIISILKSGKILTPSNHVSVVLFCCSLSVASTSHRSLYVDLTSTPPPPPSPVVHVLFRGIANTWNQSQNATAAQYTQCYFFLTMLFQRKHPLYCN